METAIIGAGFGGLAAAYELAKNGVKVTVFESNKKAGGLAGGFYDGDWQWPLDYHYHHVFETDQAVKSFLQELDLLDQLFYQTAETYTLLNRKVISMAKLDSAVSLLSFPDLSLFAKLRTGIVLAGLKLFSYGDKLEHYTAQEFLIKTMGQESWEKLWEPLFKGKFDQKATQINAAWFWARIHSRSKRLGYFHKGFLGIADQVVGKLKKMGVRFEFTTTVTEVKQLASEKGKQDSNSLLIISNKGRQIFDQVIFTGSSEQLIQLAGKQLPSAYLKQLKQLESLAAITLVLVLDKPFFKENIYWLNINQAHWPFLAVVEHTNFIDRSKYNHQHLVYVGKYLSVTDPHFKLSASELLAIYQPYLEKLSPHFKKNLVGIHLFKQEFAQPLVEKNHSLSLPKIETPLSNLYWVGMQHVYPYDRGINYALQLGRDAAQKILHHQ